ncbi:hypothetical protein WJX77_012466 [Trebouxia sp. C0004]
MDLDPQQSKSAAQASSGSLLTLAEASMQAIDGPSTSDVPASVADPALAAGPPPADTPMLPAMPWLLPQTFLTLQCPLPCAYGQRMLTGGEEEPEVGPNQACGKVGVLEPTYCSES